MRSEGLFKSVVLGLGVFTAIGLTCQTMAADLVQVRIKPQWDRIEVVLDLAGKANSVVLNKTQANQVVLEFDGKVAPGLDWKALDIPKDQNLQGLSWEEHDGQVRLVLRRKTASAVTMYPLDNPDRIVISLDNMVNTHTSANIGPGVTHHRILRPGNRGPLNINVLEIDPSNPEITVEPELASYNSLHGKARVSQMVNRRGAIAGINASFFKPDSGTVLGTVIKNKELLAGPIYNRVCLGITEDKHFRMDRLAFQGALSSGPERQLKLHNVNQPRLSKQQNILYTPKWGSLAPNTPADSLQIQIKDNQVMAISTERLSIPRDGFVMVGPAEGLATLLKPGDPIGLEVFTTPDWSNVSNALSGGPFLVKNGQLYVDTQEESFRPGAFTKPAPRTAVGYTADNRLLMVTVDGRQHGSVGVTLYEMAQLMKELGAVEAMNFDGGSSTQMVVRGHVVNSPSVAGGANVSASLVVRRLIPPVDNEVIGEASNGLDPAPATTGF